MDWKGYFEAYKSPFFEVCIHRKYLDMFIGWNGVERRRNVAPCPLLSPERLIVPLLVVHEEDRSGQRRLIYMSC